MKKIVLASTSPQRKKLLENLGIEFEIHPSRVEEIYDETIKCEKLVMHNALIKAEDVAKKMKDAIVIGADTLVYSGDGHLIGKPKDLKEAKKNLKRLFARPSWVFTGVVIIDVLKNKKLIDYEKTKVFMNRLSDKEIDRYHSIVSPLDKAGGFDIEGRGSMFIHRIEGCYANVIGLPVAKLAAMLKKMGVTILMVLFLSIQTGCTTEYNLATREQETLLYGTEKESSIGAGISKQFDKNFEYVTDVDVNERVQKILDRLVEVGDRKELVYTIKVIDEDKLNAVSLPGGYIYVYKGLIDAAKSDDELAGVIGHELGHVTAKHAMKRLQSMYGYTLLQLGAIGSGSGDLSAGVHAAFLTVFTENSQEDEFLADELGVKYAKAAGYDPKGMAQFLVKLKEEQDKEPLRPQSYWRTHPYLPQRIAVVNKEIKGKLDFKEYLNLTGEHRNF